MIANVGVCTTTDTVRRMPLCAKPHHTVLPIQLVCEHIIREEVVEIIPAVCVSNGDGCLRGTRILYRNAKARIGIQLPEGERFPCVKQNIFRLVLNYLCSAAEGKRAIPIVHTCGGVFGNGAAVQRTCPAIEQYAGGIVADYAAVQVERAVCYRNAGGTTADFAFPTVHQSEGAAGAYGNCRSTGRGCDVLSVQTKRNVPIWSCPYCAQYDISTQTVVFCVWSVFCDFIQRANLLEFCLRAVIQSVYMRSYNGIRPIIILLDPPVAFIQRNVRKADFSLPPDVILPLLI